MQVTQHDDYHANIDFVISEAIVPIDANNINSKSEQVVIAAAPTPPLTAQKPTPTPKQSVDNNSEYSDSETSYNDTNNTNKTNNNSDNNSDRDNDVTEEDLIFSVCNDEMNKQNGSVNSWSGNKNKNKNQNKNNKNNNNMISNYIGNERMHASHFFTDLNVGVGSPRPTSSNFAGDDKDKDRRENDRREREYREQVERIGTAIERMEIERMEMDRERDRMEMEKTEIDRMERDIINRMDRIDRMEKGYGGVNGGSGRNASSPSPVIQKTQRPSISAPAQAVSGRPRMAASIGATSRTASSKPPPSAPSQSPAQTPT